MSAATLERNIQYILDRLEIQDVLARYAAGQDDHQGEQGGTVEDWGKVFTPDAVLDYTQAGPAFGEKCSYQRLAEIMRGAAERPGLMSGSFHKWQHMLGLPLVEIEGDTARARTDLLATHSGRTNVGTPWHLFDGCIFHDDLIRTEKGWRIRNRRLEVHYVEIIETLQPGKNLKVLSGKLSRGLLSMSGIPTLQNGAHFGRGEQNTMANLGLLVGKVALITGGSRGIGAAIVRRLAKEGATVAFTYSSSPEKAESLQATIETAGGRALSIKADSADVEAVRKAVELAVESFGKLDILVNSAGILLRGTIDAFTVEDFDHMVAVNVRGAFVAAQAAARHMVAGGRIVVIGSTAADRIGYPGASVYCMTKSAIATLAKGMAMDLASRGITVNTVQPGPTASDMTPADGPRVGFLKGLIPVGRLGKDDEIAGLVSYVVSAEAAFITGATLTIDGGYAA